MAHTLGIIQHESSEGMSDVGLSIELSDFPTVHPLVSHEAIDREVPITLLNTPLSGRQSALLILQLTLVESFASMSNGLLTSCIPHMASDLNLPQHLIYWPSTVSALVCGSLLLVAGSIADVIGNRPVNQTGNLILGCFNLACGVARTGEQLIAFRALVGFGLALYLPSSVGTLTKAIASGRTRNIGLACSGVAQSLGFAIGLVLGGVLVQTVGWRVGYYMCGSGQLALCISSNWVLPKTNISSESYMTKWKNLQSDIDWVGAGIASTSLAMLAYVLASLTTSIQAIKQPVNIAMLSFSLVLVPTFISWVSRQERLGRPALIPNSIWKNTTFTSTCVMVLFAYATINTVELFSSLFFQQVQNPSALQASIRFLPSVILGAILNFTTGALVHRMSAFHLVIITSLLSAGAPLLMALIQPQWPYWYDAFPAQILVVLGVDVIFTVGLLIVSEVFPSHTQALAGAVFNTIAQFGNALGLAVVAVISSAVTQQSEYRNKDSSPALLIGYRAGFWAVFGWGILAVCVGFLGLRKVGRVGLKKD